MHAHSQIYRVDKGQKSIMTSLLERVQQMTDKTAKLQAEDAKRIDDVAVPALTITDEAKADFKKKCFAKIGPAVASLVAQNPGVTKVSVPLIAPEDAPRANYGGSLSHHNILTEWTYICAQLWGQLSDGWHFDRSKNSALARASFMPQYHTELAKFASQLQAMWTEFDPSLVPKVDYVFPRYGLCYYVSYQKWNSTGHDNDRLCTYVPDFVFTFDWSEAAQKQPVEEPPRPLKKSKTEGTAVCAVCKDSGINCCFGCGHGTCQPCAQRLSNCPTCRASITQKINLFF